MAQIEFTRKKSDTVTACKSGFGPKETEDFSSGKNLRSFYHEKRERGEENNLIQKSEKNVVR